MKPEFVKKFAAPVPRYTSYPTAPHFSSEIGVSEYARWLTAIPAGGKLSLYIHIPFCDALCWYCGCTTKATARYDPIVRYLDALEVEIETVGRRIAAPVEVTHIHWGGGSPSILAPSDITRIAAKIRTAFNVSKGAEFAVEVDPRNMPIDRIAAFAAAGVNRVSVGVQDFDPAVQRAINREQSFEMTEGVISAFRNYGVRSVNVDLVYGLPRQTRDSVEDTINRVLSFQPDRIALFGYAHLPSRLPHQRLIKDEDLPDTTERFAQANRAANLLMEAGYVRVGLDHFARQTDPLAKGDIHRNFQGYTSDDAPILIGLGASAIGRLPQGYVQNAPAMAEYERRVHSVGLATARGHAMSAEDEARGYAIERLMCDLHFPAIDLARRYGKAAAPVIEEARELLDADEDDLIEADAGCDGFHVTEKGRLFVRSICSVFDSYFGQTEARHSAGV